MKKTPAGIEIEERDALHLVVGLLRALGLTGQGTLTLPPKDFSRLERALRDRLTDPGEGPYAGLSYRGVGGYFHVQAEKKAKKKK